MRGAGAAFGSSHHHPRKKHGMWGCKAVSPAPPSRARVSFKRWCCRPGWVPVSGNHRSWRPRFWIWGLGFFFFFSAVFSHFFLFFFPFSWGKIYLASYSLVRWVDVKTEFLDCGSYAGFMSKSLAGECDL